MALWSNTARPKFFNATANSGIGTQQDIFPTAEGWVQRHYKGANGAYWDEIIARQEGLLEAGAANITAVAITANQNYATLTITSGVGNAFSYVYSTKAFANVFQQNSTAYTCNAEVISTSNVVPYTQLAIDTSNSGAFPASGNVLYQSNGSANNATGVVFLANSTVLRLRDVTGTFTTANVVQGNSTINAAVSAVTANVTGSLIVKRLAGRFQTSNVIQNGYSNLTISAANNWANGVVSVFFDEQVTVAGGTPSLNLESTGTTNAVATFVSSSNNTNKLDFTFTANGDSAATFAVLGQTIALNSATIKDRANSSITSNNIFATGLVANVKFGVAGANISV